MDLCVQFGRVDKRGFSLPLGLTELTKGMVFYA